MYMENLTPLNRYREPAILMILLPCRKRVFWHAGSFRRREEICREILERLGGGFEMHSEVTNVPKGSGLGTSSILSAACVKAVFEFMGFFASRQIFMPMCW